MTRCYSWADMEERYGETEAEHRCGLCGGWVATCVCPGVPDAVRCPICGLLVDLTDEELREAVLSADYVTAHGCETCRAEGRTMDDVDDTPSTFGDPERVS